MFTKSILFPTVRGGLRQGFIQDFIGNVSRGKIGNFLKIGKKTRHIARVSDPVNFYGSGSDLRGKGDPDPGVE